MFGAEWSVVFPIPFLGWAGTLWARVMKRRIMFGAPSQRATSDRPTQSWWHVPVYIDPCWYRIGALCRCRVFLEDLVGGCMIQMRWGDMCFDQAPKEMVDLQPGEYHLVPIALRDEDGNGEAYITDAEWFNDRAAWIIEDHRKRRVRLVVKSGTFTATSKASYIMRTPPALHSNGQSTLEVEFEGGGSAPVPLEPRA